MKTILHLLFQTNATSAGVQALVSAAGLQDFAISAIEQSGQTSTLTANRHLTAGEQSAIRQVVLASLVRFEAVP